MPTAIYSRLRWRPSDDWFAVGVGRIGAGSLGGQVCIRAPNDIQTGGHKEGATWWHRWPASE